MADDPWEGLRKLFEGAWFNTLDPFYGYLYIHPYISEDEGGKAVAIQHAVHGQTDPPIWFQGVWKPSDFGFEVIAGPWHWKQIAMFGTPKTREVDGSRLYFQSFMNGMGQCNMGKLGGKEELEWIEKMKDLFPTWQNTPPDERTFWRDYPNGTWTESQKYMRPAHTFDDAGQRKLNPNIPPEDQITHNGGQPVAPQVGQPAPEPPPIQLPGGPPVPAPGEPGGGDKPNPDEATAKPAPPAEGDQSQGDAGGTPPPPPVTKPEAANPNQPSADTEPAAEGAPSATPDETKPEAKSAEPATPAEDPDADKGWISKGFDKVTDGVDAVTGGRSEEATEKADEAVDKALDSVGDAVSGAAGKVFGKKKQPPPPPKTTDQARKK